MTTSNSEPSGGGLASASAASRRESANSGPASGELERCRPRLRVLEVEVVTTRGAPVIGVRALARMDDGSEYEAESDENGLAVFGEVPERLGGEVIYPDEDDMIARSFAANLAHAISSSDSDAAIGLLQSAVDFARVSEVYAESYGGNLGAELLCAFAKGERALTFDWLVRRRGLVSDELNVHEASS